jgi:hypothetical protein
VLGRIGEELGRVTGGLNQGGREGGEGSFVEWVLGSWLLVCVVGFGGLG